VTEHLFVIGTEKKVHPPLVQRLLQPALAATSAFVALFLIA